MFISLNLWKLRDWLDFLATCNLLPLYFYWEYKSLKKVETWKSFLEWHWIHVRGKKKRKRKIAFAFFRILALAYYKLTDLQIYSLLTDFLLPTVLTNFHFLSKEKCWKFSSNLRLMFCTLQTETFIWRKSMQE